MTLLCDYNMGDYFQHWIDVGNATQDKTSFQKNCLPFWTTLKPAWTRHKPQKSGLRQTWDFRVCQFFQNSLSEMMAGSFLFHYIFQKFPGICVYIIVKGFCADAKFFFNFGGIKGEHFSKKFMPQLLHVNKKQIP